MDGLDRSFCEPPTRQCAGAKTSTNRSHISLDNWDNDFELKPASMICLKTMVISSCYNNDSPYLVLDEFH